MEAFSQIVQVLSVFVGAISVIVGVVISIKSFNVTRAKDAEARRIEAIRPFLELRQKMYMEAVHAAAVLSNPDTHGEEEMKVARKRFRELYVSELSMVESPEVEAQMVELAKKIDPELTEFTPAQDAAYKLSHALRNSFIESWGVDSEKK